MNTDENKPEPFTRSPERELVEKLLLAMKEGEVLTYTRLEEEAKVSPTKDKGDYALVLAARNYLEKHEADYAFEVENGIGILRLPRDGTVTKSAKRLQKSAMKKVSKSFYKLAAVEVKRLSNEQRRDYYTAVAISGCLKQFGGKKAENKAAQLVQNNGLVQIDEKSLIAQFSR